MASNADAYWMFYIEGRRERLLRNSVDVEAMAGEALETESAEAMVSRIAKDAAAAGRSELEPPSRGGKRTKERWLRDHQDALKDAGIASEPAYLAWCAGRVDELAYSLQSDVLEAIESTVFHTIGDGDEEDDDEEDDESEDE